MYDIRISMTRDKRVAVYMLGNQWMIPMGPNKSEAEECSRTQLGISPIRSATTYTFKFEPSKRSIVFVNFQDQYPDHFMSKLRPLSTVDDIAFASIDDNGMIYLETYDRIPKRILKFEMNKWHQEAIKRAIAYDK